VRSSVGIGILGSNNDGVSDDGVAETEDRAAKE
jgi:hypothetical protein